jgi:hypothetical protein
MFQMANSSSFMSDVFQDGRTVFTPAPVGWPMDVGFNLPPSVNPLDPPPPTNFDAAMAELFSSPPFVGNVHSSDTTYMLDNRSILDPVLYLGLPPLLPARKVILFTASIMKVKCI